MTEDQIADTAALTMRGLLNQLPNTEDRRRAVELLMTLNFMLMRQFCGDQFALGWLEGATRDLASGAPFLAYRAPN